MRAIQIDAVVTDNDGNPMRGLTIDDYEITERGKPQPITTFGAVDIPIETQPADLADADVVANEGEGRVYLIVIDSICPINAQLTKRELRTVATATGGFAHVNSNNFDDSFTRLVQEQSVDYMLAFNSSQEKDDGRYVPGQNGIDRRRSGNGPACARPHRTAGRQHARLCHVRVVPTDVRAKVVPQIRHVGDVTMAASARDNAERRLHVLTKVDLPPGRFQLRIAGGTAQRGGSVVYDLEVPDFTKKDLAMSGVALRGSRTLRLDTPLPLTTLAAGRYVLSVNVRSSAGGDSVNRTQNTPAFARSASARSRRSLGGGGN